MSKRPFIGSIIELSYPLQLKIDHLLHWFSEQQETEIDYNSSIKSFESAQQELIMPSSIPFGFDFDINKLKIVKTKKKKKKIVGNYTETVEVELPLIESTCIEFQLIYYVTKFRHASDLLQWTTGSKFFNKWKEILEDTYDIKIWDQKMTSHAFTRTVDNF